MPWQDPDLHLSHQQGQPHAKPQQDNSITLEYLFSQFFATRTPQTLEAETVQEHEETKTRAGLLSAAKPHAALGADGGSVATYFYLTKAKQSAWTDARTPPLELPGDDRVVMIHV